MLTAEAGAGTAGPGGLHAAGATAVQVGEAPGIVDEQLGALRHQLFDLGVEIATGHRATELIVTDGTVAGVRFETYESETVDNAEPGHIAGFELTYQRDLTGLAAPWDGLGLAFNVAWIDSAVRWASSHSTWSRASSSSCQRNWASALA